MHRIREESLTLPVIARYWTRQLEPLTQPEVFDLLWCACLSGDLLHSRPDEMFGSVRMLVRYNKLRVDPEGKEVDILIPNGLEAPKALLPTIKGPDYDCDTWTTDQQHEACISFANIWPQLKAHTRDFLGDSTQNNLKVHFADFVKFCDKQGHDRPDFWQPPYQDRKRGPKLERSKIARAQRRQKWGEALKARYPVGVSYSSVSAMARVMIEEGFIEDTSLDHLRQWISKNYDLHRRKLKSEVRN